MRRSKAHHITLMTPDGIANLNRLTKFTSDIVHMGKDWKSYFDTAGFCCSTFTHATGKNKKKNDLEDKYECDEG